MSASGVVEIKHKIAGSIYEAHSQKRRGLVIVRCSSPSVVDRARESMMAVKVPFGWRSLPVAELDPPDLLGFVQHAGGAAGPCFLAYGLPKGLDGRVDPQFVSYLNSRLDAYLSRPTLMVLFVTLDEMREVSTPARGFWNCRDILVAWPAEPESGRYLPAHIRGGVKAGQFGGLSSAFSAQPNKAYGGPDKAYGGPQAAYAGPDQAYADPAQAYADSSYIPDPDAEIQPEHRAIWAGCPYSGDKVPKYLLDTKPPAGRRWGDDLVPDDHEGALALDRARYQLAIREVDQARSGLTKAAKRFRADGLPLAAAECYVLLGMAGEQRLDLTVALEWYDVALKLFDQLEEEGYADVASMIGYILFLQGQMERAADAFERAYERAQLVQDDYRTATMARRVGILCEQAGDHDRAETLYEKARDIEEDNEDRRALSRTLNNLARVKRAQKKLDEAKETLEHSIELKEALGDEGGLASSYHELGNLLFHKQEMEKALEAYERALEIEWKLSDVAGIAFTQAQIGLVHRELLNFPESVTAFMVARGLFRRLDSPHVSTIEKALEQSTEMMDVWQVRQLDVAAQEVIDEILSS